MWLDPENGFALLNSEEETNQAQRGENNPQMQLEHGSLQKYVNANILAPHNIGDK